MNVREWVYNALDEVIRSNTYSNLYLKEHLQEVDEKDQALASNIFYGTLQNYTLCEYAWKRFAKQKVGRKVGILLSMSVYQLLFLQRVPDYAVIDEANRIAAKRFPEKRAFVNAVLRKVVTTPLRYPDHPIEAMALQTSLPEWLITMWVKQYGPKSAFNFAKASLAALPVTVRRNPMKLDAKKAADYQRLEKIEDPELNPDGVLYRYTGNAIGKDHLYTSGAISVQDPASYKIARWTKARPNVKILDLCAAPGTKSMAMAEMAEDQAEILSLDLHDHRVSLIQNDAKRLNLNSVKAKQADSSKLEPNPEYDIVLCDVPCSGLGVLARKPDMKLHLKPAMLDELLPLQKEILASGAGQVKDGGLLIYSTCTLNRKENEKQVESFLTEHPDFTLLDQKTIEPNAQHGGFFIASLQKQA